MSSCCCDTLIILGVAVAVVVVAAAAAVVAATTDEYDRFFELTCGADDNADAAEDNNVVSAAVSCMDTATLLLTCASPFINRFSPLTSFLALAFAAALAAQLGWLQCTNGQLVREQLLPYQQQRSDKGPVMLVETDACVVLDEGPVLTSEATTAATVAAAAVPG